MAQHRTQTEKKSAKRPPAPPKSDRHTAQREVQDTLDAIAAAVTSGDGAAVAALWETPAFILGPTMAETVTSTEELARFFASAKAQYNERGIVDTNAEILDEEWIGDGLVVAKVRWPYFDTHGAEVGAEASDYTLRRDETGKLRVRYVLMRGVERGQH